MPTINNSSPPESHQCRNLHMVGEKTVELVASWIAGISGGEEDGTQCCLDRRRCWLNRKRVQMRWPGQNRRTSPQPSLLQFLRHCRFRRQISR